MSIANKLYKVTNRGVVSLVSAPSTNAAFRHVAEKDIQVELLKAVDVPPLLTEGVKVETAGGEG